MEKYTLVGVDGNAFAVMGYVRRAMRECGRSKEEIDEYTKRATSSDYNNLLCVSMGVISELNEECDCFDPMDESESLQNIHNRQLIESVMKNMNNAIKKALNENNNLNYMHETVRLMTYDLYIGDPCYALDDEYYYNVWGKNEKYLDGIIEDEEGTVYGIVHGTFTGDGTYKGLTRKYVYGVDSGTISVIDLQYRKDEINNLNDLNDCGRYVHIPSGICTVDFIYENGIFNITITDDETNKVVCAEAIDTKPRMRRNQIPW